MLDALHDSFGVVYTCVLIMSTKPQLAVICLDFYGRPGGNSYLYPFQTSWRRLTEY